MKKLTIAAALAVLSFVAIAPAKADPNCSQGGPNCTICTYWEDGSIHCYARPK